MNNEIIIYQNQQNETEVQVRFEGDTFWLSQRLMAVLFDKDSDTIGLHLRNIYEELELDELATTEFFSVVQIEGKREVTRKIKHYNLDAILSVGYRVNSKRGTQFRQWATARLKDFLVKGYAINQKRLDELSQMVSIIAQSTQSDNLKLNEAKGLLNVLSNYTQSYILLNQFDNHSLKTDNLNENVTYKIKYEEAKPQIDALKQKLIDLKEATALFGNEKDNSFRGILGNVLQTYDGEYLYPSIEEQAANLLYFVIKNHPFNDGNKRIGAFLFIWFLEKNKHRLDTNGNVKINEFGLVALALLVAQSNPSDKDLMINLIISLIQNR
ncbi:MAG: virulence protein RhuM/Fic/DOC family protein [Saprospiraceae bacterium]|nr:virulence protein RhuM/Fic/DOC family protein [Saprospiraceae bacterium]